MKRKAAWVGLSFMSGTMLFELWSRDIRVLLVCTALLAVIGLQLPRKIRVYSSVVGLFLFAGVLNGLVYTHFHTDPERELSGETVTITGIASECREISSDRFMITVDGKTEGGVNADIVVYSAKPVEPRNIVKFTCKVSELKNNPVFSRADYYGSRGIVLTGFAEEIRDTGKCGDRFMRLADSLRDRTAECIGYSVDGDASVFLQALICGDKRELPQAERTSLYRSGLGHILAVSGLHLSVIALIFSTIFSTLKVPKKLRSLLMFLVILVFMGFAGFSPSVTRAGIMLIMMYASTLFGRRTDDLNTLGVCALVMTAAMPYAVLSVSFTLSFASAAAVGVVSPVLTKKLEEHRLHSIKSALIKTLVILAVTMPLQMLYFDEVSVASPLTNLLLLPICTLALVLLPFSMLLGGTTAPAQLLFRISGLLVNSVLRCCRWLADSGVVSIPGCRRFVLYISAVALFGVLCQAFARRSARVFALGGTIVLAFAYAASAFAGYLDRDNVHITIMNYNHGTTAVITRGSEALVLDIGSKGRLTDSVQKLFSYRGVRSFDAVFIKGDTNADRYRSLVIPPAEDICTELGYYGESFVIGDSADLDGLIVIRTKSGFSVSAYGTEIELTSESLKTDGKVLRLSELDSIAEFEIDDESTELFTLDSGFHRTNTITLPEGG